MEIAERRKAAMNSTKGSSWTIEVAESNFESEVIQRSYQVPVVVDFWAPWCNPCRVLAPILESHAAEYAGAFMLAKVNIDQAPALARRHGVEAIPAVKAFRDGVSVLGFVGLAPAEQIRELIKRVLPTQSDQLAAEGLKLENSDRQRAEEKYRAALERDRNQAKAILGLTRLLIERREGAEAAPLLERLGEHTDHAAEISRLRAILSLRELTSPWAGEQALQDRRTREPENARTLYELGCTVAAAGRYQEGLDLLLRAAEHDRGLASSVIREAMVNIFHIIGTRSATADEYRDKLTKLLY